MGVYRLEIASTGRAVCKNKECKDNQVKISKGSLRFCTQFEVNGNQSWAYKHWGCVTPVQIQNVKETIEDNLDYLDGYDEIGPELQAKVSKALEEGHVDDSDWTGDPEQNRPGSKGVRMSASKKKEMTEKAEDKVGRPTASQPATKKRGRPKKNEDANDVEADGPPPKKSKPASARGKITKAENVDADELPPKTVTTSKKAKKVVADNAGGGSEDEEPKPKKSRARGKKADVKQSTDLSEVKEEKNDYCAASAPPAQSKSKRKVATSKKVKSEEGESLDESEAVEDKPKAKKGQKPATAVGDVLKPKNPGGRAPRTRKG